jgi:glycosyltransferase involved in cell wall biosynthesis
MPKVSVIIPAYNEKRYVRRCIESVVNQTLDSKEIIAINDGSTDDTLKILKQYESNNIKVIDQENKGTGAARNAGLKEATGEFIQFLDADDYLQPKALETLYNCAKENDVPLVRMEVNVRLGKLKLGDYNYFGKIKSSQRVDIRKEKDYIVECISSVGDKFIKHDLLDDLSFPEGMKWEDLSIIPFILAKSKELFHLNQKLYNYNFLFNTTINDTFNKCNKFTDLFKILDLLNQRFDDAGLSIEYKDQLEQLTVLHILLRLCDVISWRNISSKDREEIINHVVNILNIKCPNWVNNRILNVRKDLFFKKSVKTAKNRMNINVNSNMNESINTIERVLKKQP